jgi:hypothetical protein
MTPMIIQCYYCKHYNAKANTCAAFPEEIPDVIVAGLHNHKEPYPGDNDIRWEERKPKT